MTDRVLAKATVDRLPGGVYRVHVWGMPPHDYDRYYEIEAADENKAANDALRRFEQEMESK